MLIRVEEELLNEATRRSIIKEIEGTENKRRKAEAYKRYQVFKDRTDLYVYELLLRQFDQATVEEMRYAISNVSLCRKVIDKLARVYSGSVVRTTDPETSQQMVDELANVLCFNSRMKKQNRLLKLMRNSLCYIKPVKEGDKWGVKVVPMLPFLYDVVEDPHNREKELCVILSNYEPETMRYTTLDAATAGRSRPAISEPMTGDGVDQKLADSPQDNGPKKTYVWWTKSYHFTTDEKGIVLSQVTPEGGENPIGRLPFVNFAEDQDESYWALGGHDLVDGSIAVNSLITNFNHIGTVQGYGQFWMKISKDRKPGIIKTGPTQAIIIEQQAGDPEAAIGYASSSPQLAELRNNVNQYVALLLSTNNLSVNTVSASLDSGRDFASGIALMIDKSESMEDVKSQEQIFSEREPEIWQCIASWLEYFRGQQQLSETLTEFVLPQDIIVTPRFIQSQPLMTETERLAIYEKRLGIGLSTLADIIKLDDPNLSEEQVQQRMDALRQSKAPINDSQGN